MTNPLVQQATTERGHVQQQLQGLPPPHPQSFGGAQLPGQRLQQHALARPGRPQQQREASLQKQTSKQPMVQCCWGYQAGRHTAGK